jgi:hypothetical protein
MVASSALEKFLCFNMTIPFLIAVTLFDSVEVTAIKHIIKKNA